MTRSQPRDIEFLHWASIPNYRHVVDTVVGDYYTVQFVDSADAQLVLGGCEYELKAGTFWSSRPGDHIHHQAQCIQSGFTQRYVAMNGPLARQWEEAGLLPFAPQSAPAGKDYGAEFDRMLGWVQQRTSLAQMRAINLLEGILLDLAESRQASQTPAWLKAVLEKVDDPFCFHLDMEELARTAGMAVPTLRRRFRQVMGAAINDYHIRRRVDAVKQALLQSDEPIRRISERMGYQNLPFFVRQFRQFVGVSPKEYRKNPYSVEVIK